MPPSPLIARLPLDKLLLYLIDFWHAATINMRSEYIAVTVVTSHIDVLSRIGVIEIPGFI